MRSTNFEEVALGYTAEMAMEEADRCLNCKKSPCVSGCPVNVRIPEFLSLAKEGKFIEAYEVIKSTNGCPPYAEEYVLRKISARVSVSAVSKASRSVLDVLSVFVRIMLWRRVISRNWISRKTAEK